MADLDVVCQGNVLHFDTGPKSDQYKEDTAESANALLGVPLSKQLDFLTELGDVLG